MLHWKLLGDLLPSELRLECERAGISPSSKDSHNCIRLSKYVMSNGCDPETFFFNTIYQTDKTSPLIGMTPGAGGKASSQAKIASAVPLATGTATPIQMDSAPRNSLLHPSDDHMKTLLNLFTTMSENIKKLVTLTEGRKQKDNTIPDTDSNMGSDGSLDGSDDRSEDGSSGTPSWYSFGSNPSVYASDVAISNYSSFKHNRRYDKELLITDNICLAYQHGNCSFGENYQGFHESEHGSGDVFHCCGLCWTDSPDNQCYDPAYKCKGPFSIAEDLFFGRNF